MFTQRDFNLFIQIILILSAINWGIAAFAGADIVRAIVGVGVADRVIKALIACAGLYHAYMVSRTY